MTNFGQKGSITEIVQWGQGKIVLYTESLELYNQFKDDKKCLKAQDYRRDGRFLAADLYYSKSYRETLTRRLERLKK